MRTLLNLFIAVLVLAALGYGGAKFYIHSKVSDSVDAMLLMAAPFAQVQYTGISSNLAGELTMDNVSIKMNGYRDSIDIGRMGIKTKNFIALLKLTDFANAAQSGDTSALDEIGFIAQDIRILASSDFYRDWYDKNIEALQPADIRQRGVQCVGKYGFSPKTLQALGYGEMLVSVGFIVRQAEDRFVTEMEFDVVEMTDVDVSITMGGSAMAGAMMGAAYRPTLHHLEIVVTDRSLNQRVTKHCSELGLSPEQITRAQLAALHHFGDNMGITFDEYIVEPYKEYLAGKSTFIATARPRAPLDIGTIDAYAPGDIPALLNLESVAR